MVQQRSICLACLLLLAFLPAWSRGGATRFLAARPVWPEGRERERNLTVGFRALIPLADTAGARRIVLRLAASTVYRASVNGRFLGYGPARGPRGYFRVDRWDLGGHLHEGTNIVAVEVAGYNVNSYYTLDQPSFLQAEIVVDGRVLAATAKQRTGFVATVLSERVRKVQRYSFQRPFIEVYRLGPGVDAWKSDPQAAFAEVPCAEPAGMRRLLPRRVPYPRFVRRAPMREIAAGRIRTGITPKHLWKDRSLVHVGPKLGGYPEKELAIIPSTLLQTMAPANMVKINRLAAPDQHYHLTGKTYRILDLGTNRSGFLGATIQCAKQTRLFITFDEILSHGDVDFKRLGCVNALTCDLQPGCYQVESFEPYTLRYLKLMVLEGAADLSNIYLREYTNPAVWEASFAASDPRLNRLFDAGRETYRQNAVDVFMDCPSRERAGWLCDSFFTARAACDLSGTTVVEHNFFENFLLPEKFKDLPAGMLPMCYPADHNDGVFIPNWALWFVVQLEEYLARSGDRATVDALRGRVLEVFDYFERFRNEDGLLEKLDGWVFVEWSAASRFVQDVNYPTNMLYAAALAAAGRMYGRDALITQAQQIRATIQKQSFDGTFFVDNAIRRDGKLRPTRNRTEVCQYFAFFFDVASPSDHPRLWRTVCEKFGPDRKQTGALPEVHLANAFVGNMLRFEILSRYAKCQQILDESVAYLLYMAEKTGTLWENVDPSASCDHGFASHIVRTLYRDVLGLYRIDQPNKTITVRFADLDLDWCQGRVPTRDGPVSLHWRRHGNTLTWRLDLPAGYHVQVENRSRYRLRRKP